MNKITGFILSFFILISSFGLAINIHYCHDKVASITLGYPESDSCDDEGTCCAKANNHKKCCSETTIKTEKESDNFVVTTLNFELQQFVPYQHFDFNFQKEIVSIEKQKLIENYSESHSPPLYKLYCQLVFYA